MARAIVTQEAVAEAAAQLVAADGEPSMMHVPARNSGAASQRLSATWTPGKKPRPQRQRRLSCRRRCRSRLRRSVVPSGRLRWRWPSSRSPNYAPRPSAK
jgi:hypothetical protein